MTTLHFDGINSNKVGRVAVFHHHLTGSAIAQSHVLPINSNLSTANAADSLVTSGNTAVSRQCYHVSSRGDGGTGSGVVEAYFRERDSCWNLDTLSVDLNRESSRSSHPVSEVSSWNYSSISSDVNLIKSIRVDCSAADVAAGNVSWST